MRAVAAQASRPAVMVISLGARAGTKAKRPEADLLRPADWLAWQLVTWLCAGLEQGALLVGGYTYGRYRGHMARFTSHCRLCPYRPHSPRAGRATELYLRGVPFVEIREHLRHRDDRSLRTYLDIVAMISNWTEGDTARWKPAADFIEQHLWAMLAGDAGFFVALRALCPVPLPVK